MITKNKIIERLKVISSDKEAKAIERYVADYLLDEFNEEYETVGEIKEWFKIFWENDGCKTGIILGLIYYEDTYKFFDTYSEDILMYLEESTYDDYKLTRDLFNKNSLAWFGFECALSDIQLIIFREEE
jgi:hypothetical protein